MPLSIGTVVGSDLANVPAHVRALEALGFDAVTVGETRHNPFLPLVLVAEHTQRMRFGTSVAIAFPRVPHVTANIAWDLSAYSGGRFTLGLGTQVKGHNERRFSVPWAPPGPRLRDYVSCMREIWDSWQHGTRPDYEGEFYQYRLTGPDFNPGPIEHPDIPVIISAVSPFNARLAGEICNGIAVHEFSTFRYIREVLIPAAREGAASVGRDFSRFAVWGGGFIVTGPTEAAVERARERTRRQIALFASTRSSSGVMKFHQWEDEAERLHRLSIDGAWEALDSVITDEMMDEFCVIARWDELPDKIREKCAGISTQINLPVEPSDLDEGSRFREVIAALKSIPSLSD